MNGTANVVNPVGFSYATGPLGYYYQNGTSLTDKGSSSASVAGLFHYTTKTALGTQVKDDGYVDIGLHYVATDASGIPSDFDSDTLPDYLEDVNGNGNDTPDAGETNWKTADLVNEFTLPSGLILFTPLK